MASLIELRLDVAAEETVGRLRVRLAANGIGTLNVAGSRESKVPGIGAYVARVIGLALAGDRPHGGDR